MTTVPDFDSITADQLRARGSLKWSRGEAIGAFVAEMDFGTAPPVAAALADAVERRQLGYPNARMFEDLRLATAAWVAATQAWALDPSQVFPVADVLTGLRVEIEAHTRAGEAIIVPTPAYMPFLRFGERLGREVVQTPARRDGRLDLAAIDEAFARGARLLVLCDPHNPLGRSHGPEELDALAEIVAKHDARVFADEIWAPLVLDGRHTSYASRNQTSAAHAVTAVSAAKGWNIPGLKCAQLIATNQDDRLRLHGQAAALREQASILGIIANTAAYREGEDWLSGVRDYLRGNRDLIARFVAERMPGVGFVPPSATYVAWLDFRGLGFRDPARFCSENAGVELTEGSACGQVGEGWARLIFATPRPVLIDALERIAGALANR